MLLLLARRRRELNAAAVAVGPAIDQLDFLFFSLLQLPSALSGMPLIR
jgi:hypothetical protein